MSRTITKSGTPASIEQAEPLSIGEIAQRIQLIRGQHSKYLPLAFTEHGAIMAATLLNSPRATAISVHVVRAFVELRAMMASNQVLAQKVNTLERKVSTHERNIAELADSMAQLLHTPAEPAKRPIGFINPDDPSSTKNAGDKR